MVSTTYKDLGGNLWVGYRNAGIQVISQNRIAYKKANDNLLAENTKGIAILSMTTAGKHILASTALHIFIFDEQNQKFGQTLLKNIFDSLPAPRKINLKNMVKFDDQHAWLVSDYQVLSCRISNERVEVLHKSPVFSPVLGNGLAVDGHLYVSSRDGKLLRFSFDNLQPDTLLISSPHYTNDTEMAKLSNGDIMLFMSGMHLAIFTPKTRKLKELKEAGMTK